MAVLFGLCAALGWSYASFYGTRCPLRRMAGAIPQAAIHLLARRAFMPSHGAQRR
jgi:hypothetical protein